MINAYDSSYNGGGDAFALKMASDGSALLWSTFLGYSGSEQGLQIDANIDGLCAISGITQGGFPLSTALIPPITAALMMDFSQY